MYSWLNTSIVKSWKNKNIIKISMYSWLDTKIIPVLNISLQINHRNQIFLFDKYPFVNGQTIFTCISRVQRWPTFVPHSLQYSWTVSGGVRNISTIYPVSKLDKGKQISCRANDDLGIISDWSEDINLDPYCE
jgi:hypothetical protein